MRSVAEIKEYRDTEEDLVRGQLGERPEFESESVRPSVVHKQTALFARWEDRSIKKCCSLNLLTHTCFRYRASISRQESSCGEISRTGSVRWSDPRSNSNRFSLERRKRRRATELRGHWRCVGDDACPPTQ